LLAVHNALTFLASMRTAYHPECVLRMHADDADHRVVVEKLSVRVQGDERIGAVGEVTDLAPRRELVRADEGEVLVARDDRVGVDGTHVDVVSFPAVEVGDDVHGIDGDAGFVEGRPDEGVRVPPAGQLVGTRPAGFDGWPTTRAAERPAAPAC